MQLYPIYLSVKNVLKKYVGGFVMINEVLDEVEKGLDWKEKMFMKIFKKVALKIYKKGMVDCFNYYNKI